MAEVYSLPASTSLLNEVNAVGDPKRIKTQDGTIGDRAHMTRVSDHNLDELGNTGSSSDADKIPEVHARDIDSRGPWLPGWSMARIVAVIVARCAAGLEKRLKYVIFDGWIYEADNGWKKRKYTGADQHHEHAHFSFRYGSGTGTSNPENITTPWGLLAAHQADLEDDMPTADEIAAAVEKRIFAHESTDYADTKTPKRKLTLDTWVGYSDSRRNSVLTAVAKLQATTDAILKNVVSDDGDRAAILAEIDTRAAEILDALTAETPDQPPAGA